MKLTITKCIHVTQTEKRHLLAFFQSGMTQAKVNRKTYIILSGQQSKNDSWDYVVKILTPYTRDNGEKSFDNQTIELNVQKP